MQPGYKSASLLSRHAALGSLTVTFVDLGEIRAVVLRGAEHRRGPRHEKAGEDIASHYSRPRKPPVYVGALRV